MSKCHWVSEIKESLRVLWKMLIRSEKGGFFKSSRGKKINMMIKQFEENNRNQYLKIFEILIKW